MKCDPWEDRQYAQVMLYINCQVAQGDTEAEKGPGHYQVLLDGLLTR